MSQLPPKNVVKNNLLSNISPPSELPSFVTATIAQPALAEAPVSPNIPDVAVPAAAAITSVPLVSSGAAPVPMYSIPNSAGVQSDPFLPTTFSPAVAPNLLSHIDVNAVPATHEPDLSFSNLYLNPNALSAALDPIAQSGSNLFGWVKGAAEKVAEKSKSAVDSIVTTLDPQMREYLLSGGDIEILIASDKDDKVRPIRDAFQTIFGRATLTGLPAQSKTIAAQPIGFANGLAAAQERIFNLRQSAGPGANLPVIALENFIVELFPDQWFDAGLLLISDVLQNIESITVTQMTPIPLSVIATIRAETLDDYEFKNTGFAVTIGQVMGNNLRVHHAEWHAAFTSIRRSEMILAAAKSLAFIYKQQLMSANSQEQQQQP